MSEETAITNFIPEPEVYPPGKGKCAVCLQVRTLRGLRCEGCVHREKMKRIAAGGESNRARVLTEKFAAMVAKLNEDHPDVPSISLISSRMIAALGGVDEYVTRWMQILISDKTSNKAKLDGFGAIAKFCVISGEQNAAIAGLKSMSTEELNGFVMDMLAEEMQTRGLRLVSDDDGPQEAVG